MNCHQQGHQPLHNILIKLLELSRPPHVYSERYKDLLNIVKLHTYMFHDFHNIKREEPLLGHDVFTKVGMKLICEVSKVKISKWHLLSNKARRVKAGSYTLHFYLM